jgi:glucuronate isomerase
VTASGNARRTDSAQAASVPAPASLDPDRYFDPDPSIRRVARELFDETQLLPLICPHGHVDPRILAENKPFPEPTGLLITPDHYIFRMMYSRGVPLESLGIPARDGTPTGNDPREVWKTFAAHYYLFRGTPTGAWVDHELHDLFGVRVKLSADTALRIYDEIAEKLRSPEFRPRALFDRFNIEVLATTDAPTDTLEYHQAIRDSDWDGTVVPCFRPDALFRIASPIWDDAINALSKAHGVRVTSFASFTDALAERRRFFQRMGATSTDHAVVDPYTERLPPAEIESLFALALQGRATAIDQQRFEAHMLMEMARMSTEDGLVMQIHPGSLRDHHDRIADRFGSDMGADIPIVTEYTRNLRALLNAYGADPRLTLILYTLDEATYSRELAPLAGHYPAVRLGSPWWFHDSIEGLMRFRQQTTETAGIYNTAGFNDDTRAFCSIGARHDLARRVDANFLGSLVARHIVDLSDARQMARALAYEIAKETYKLNVGRAERRDGARPTPLEAVR